MSSPETQQASWDEAPHTLSVSIALHTSKATHQMMQPWPIPIECTQKQHLSTLITKHCLPKEKDNQYLMNK